MPGMDVAQKSGDPWFGWAWVTFAALLALHVADEAKNDFLAVYNPNARAIRARYSFVPIPVLTMSEFLIGLSLLVLLLLCLSPFAFRESKPLCRIAIPLSVIAGLVNGAAHLASSRYVGQWMPGSYSSPLLIAGGSYLLVTALRSLGRLGPRTFAEVE
jgi:hypothetical protein